MQKSISTFQAQGPHIIGASAALFPTPEDHEFLGIGRGRAHPSDDMRSGVVESRVLYNSPAVKGPDIPTDIY